MPNFDIYFLMYSRALFFTESVTSNKLTLLQYFSSFNMTKNVSCNWIKTNAFSSRNIIAIQFNENIYLSSQMSEIVATLNLPNDTSFAKVRSQMLHNITGNIWLEFLFDLFRCRTIHVNAFIWIGCFLLFY